MSWSAATSYDAVDVIVVFTLTPVEPGSPGSLTELWLCHQSIQNKHTYLVLQLSVSGT